jgi:aspartyl-tRNA(Asn)/glutamyl-tRNA(Gln) amidotransferase subunit A
VLAGQYRESRRSSHHAPCERRARFLIGKTNLHEFALGTTSEDSAFGAVHHPSDPARSAGGSSGGSAAAVALGMGLASIGSDTGGSIRIPSSVCGTVGLKPGIGEVPTAGVIPLSTTFDHVGPLTRSVADAATLWSILTQSPPPSLNRELRGLRLVRLVDYFDRPIEPAVRTAFERALESLRRGGAIVKDAVLPNTAGILDAYVSIVLPEGAAWHAPYLDIRAGDYSPMVRARFESGRAIPAVKYVQAMEFCRRLRADVDALSPTRMPSSCPQCQSRRRSSAATRSRSIRRLATARPSAPRC